MRLRYLECLVIVLVLIARDAYAQDVTPGTFNIEGLWGKDAAITFSRACERKNSVQRVDMIISKEGTSRLYWGRGLKYFKLNGDSAYISADTGVVYGMLKTITPAFIDTLSKVGNKWWYGDTVYSVGIERNDSIIHFWQKDNREIARNPALAKLLKPLINMLDMECKKYIPGQ
jgi:hypothetical protein